MTRWSQLMAVALGSRCSGALPRSRPEWISLDAVPAPLPSPEHVRGQWKQTTEFNGDAPGDRAGQDVSMSDDGTVIAMRLPGYKKNGKTVGSVRVFELKDGKWKKRGNQLVNHGSDLSNTSLKDLVVSLSGDGSVLAYGLPHGSFKGNRKAGVVYVFHWDGGSWTARGESLGGDGPERFAGQSISLNVDGSVIALGVPATEAGGSLFWEGSWRPAADALPDTNKTQERLANHSGYVHVYEWNLASTMWELRGAPLGSMLDARQQQLSSSVSTGQAVSLSWDGNTVAYGEPFHSSEAQSRVGAVHVAVWDGSAWWPKGERMLGETQCRNAGSLVSLSGSGSVVAFGGGGCVVTYSFSTPLGLWQKRGGQLVNTSHPTYDGAGRYSLTLSRDGGTLAYLVPHNQLTDAGGGNWSSPGAVRIFSWADQTWKKKGEIIGKEANGTLPRGTKLNRGLCLFTVSALPTAQMPPRRAAAASP